MALQAINLPSINGAYELGLSVGIDGGVSDDIKLPVLNSGDDSAVYRSMVTFVATSSHFDAWGLRAKPCISITYLKMRFFEVMSKTTQKRFHFDLKFGFNDLKYIYTCINVSR